MLNTYDKITRIKNLFIKFVYTPHIYFYIYFYMSALYFLIFSWFLCVVSFSSYLSFCFAMLFRPKLLFFNLFQSACRPTSLCFTDLVIIITVRNAMYHRGRPTSREMTVEMQCSSGCLFSKRNHYLLMRKNEWEREGGKKGLNEAQAAAANADDRKKEKEGGTEIERKWRRTRVKGESRTKEGATSERRRTEHLIYATGH